MRCELKRLLRRLKTWCKNHPEHCDFLDDIEDLSETCPKSIEELDDFWKAFDALLTKKKELEDRLGKAAEDAQDDMDEIDDDVTELEKDIKNLNEQKRKKYLEDQARKQKSAQAEAKEAAAAKAAADKRKKKKKQQKKDDDKIKKLIKNAKSNDAGDDAFKNLIKGMGLDLLDEATGNAKLGKIIGGILVVKNMPDCACKMFEMLQQAVRAQLNGQDLFRYVFTNEYLRQWNSCANLPVFSSIMIGAEELSEAIGDMSKAQCRKTIKALDQAMRVQCK
ncbi:hypothetical protein A9Q87_04225 [Flavobacteriales bacterium 34_180_T64]|nr:hypothetical protein A9Q87_04225 [Flavobacteriales bacterium 34_180_T64]